MSYYRRDHPLVDMFEIVFKMAEAAIWMGTILYFLMWGVGLALLAGLIWLIIYLCQHLSLGWS